jgi:hypothetical protein
VALCVATAVAAPSALGASTKSCGSIHDPYPNTRYAGADIGHVRATGVSCTTARKVARGAHRKALGITPSLNGIRTFSWNGWHVKGDLRPAHDTYVAARGSKRVRWTF